MAKTLEELDAYQLARAFKREVYRLLRANPEVKQDIKLWSQLRDAVRSSESNVAEGWKRYWPAQINQFLNIALGSNEEGKVRLRDVIDDEYMTEGECEKAFELGRRAGAAIKEFMNSVERLPPRPPKRKR